MEEWHQLASTACAVLVAAVAVGHVVACSFFIREAGKETKRNGARLAASLLALAPCGAVTLVARALCGFTGLGLPSRALIVGAASMLTMRSLLEGHGEFSSEVRRRTYYPVLHSICTVVLRSNLTLDSTTSTSSSSSMQLYFKLPHLDLPASGPLAAGGRRGAFSRPSQLRLTLAEQPSSSIDLRLGPKFPLPVGTASAATGSAVASAESGWPLAGRGGWPAANAKRKCLAPGPLLV
jgi:hypothetical protein